MDHAWGDKAAVASAEKLLLAINPLFEGACDDKQYFFLIRMLVKAMRFAGHKTRIQYGELLCPG